MRFLRHVHYRRSFLLSCILAVICLMTLIWPGIRQKKPIGNFVTTEETTNVKVSRPVSGVPGMSLGTSNIHDEINIKGSETCYKIDFGLITISCGEQCSMSKAVCFALGILPENFKYFEKHDG